MTDALSARLEHDDAAYAHYLTTASGLAAIAAGKRARDALLGLRPGDRALEVACGLGDDARRLAEAGIRVTGLDVSAAMLERAGDGCEWVVGDAQALPFADAAFDAARVERALQHMADPVAAVGEMVRVVRPGGVVLACEPDWDTLALSGSRQDLVDRLGATAAGVIRHPRVGRELPGLLVDAGVHDVRVSGEALVITDMATLNVLADLPALVGAAGGGELEAFAAELARDAEAGRLLAAVTVVSAWGVVGRR